MSAGVEGLGNGEERDGLTQVLDIYKGCSARAEPQAKDIWIQVFRERGPRQNQWALWKIAQKFVHEYLHLLEHPRYTIYRNSLGKGTHACNALKEGLVSLLTEIVWSDILPLVDDPAL